MAAPAVGLGVFAIAALVILLIAFLLFPGFFLALALIVAGILVLLLGAPHPWAVPGGILLILLGGVLALIAQGQQLSLSLVHLAFLGPAAAAGISLAPALGLAVAALRARAIG